MSSEQSYFNTPNLAGALSIVEAGITEDSHERKEEIHAMSHISRKFECFHCFFFCC